MADTRVLAMQAGGPRRREVVRRFAADATVAEAATEALRVGTEGLEDQLRADLRLLAMELVSNAARHAGVPGGTIELRVAIDPDVIRVSVLDGGAGFAGPAGPVAPPEGPGGWGLHLVDERASRWGVRHDGLNEVWLELDRDHA